MKLSGQTRKVARHVVLALLILAVLGMITLSVMQGGMG